MIYVPQTATYNQNIAKLFPPSRITRSSFTAYWVIRFYLKIPEKFVFLIFPNRFWSYTVCLHGPNSIICTVSSGSLFPPNNSYFYTSLSASLLYVLMWLTVLSLSAYTCYSLWYYQFLLRHNLSQINVLMPGIEVAYLKNHRFTTKVLVHSFGPGKSVYDEDNYLAMFCNNQVFRLVSNRINWPASTQ